MKDEIGKASVIIVTGLAVMDIDIQSHQEFNENPRHNRDVMDKDWAKVARGKPLKNTGLSTPTIGSAVDRHAGSEFSDF